MPRPYAHGRRPRSVLRSFEHGEQGVSAMQAARRGLVVFWRCSFSQRGVPVQHLSSHGERAMRMVHVPGRRGVRHRRKTAPAAQSHRVERRLPHPRGGQPILAARARHFEPRGCAKNTCPPGLEIDEETGYCITPPAGHRGGEQHGGRGRAKPEARVPPGRAARRRGPQACVRPGAAACGRDEQWDGQRCRKLVQCAPGSSFDPKTGTA